MAKKKTQRKKISRKKKAGASARKPKWSIVTYDQIEVWRKDRKLPKKRMAMLLGVTNSTYHNWARGIAVATYNTQRKIQEIMDKGEVPAHVLAQPRSGGRAAGVAGGGTQQRLQELTLATDLVKSYVEANPGKITPEGLVDLIGQVRGQLRG